ncbi:Ras family protein [Trichomonas vaginalis G3]|uniref:Ras family protein n=1 Tax=Trichomonas vaginalis (strain ATCC PRA-98 / G3) TaxID=412133 RepID=A2EF66_TRIV3|nr:GTPase protein [Trichomonas vaginalis G3]EAY08676.1 Ras family protein [Trichomonas vaginalis G3]KAI5492793.1 GTPase protein [Trichomonas vaginalis G3]|eukprot:XP_001320899.1 Ras family protein [Trichomonas vaginalis G3]
MQSRSQPIIKVLFLGDPSGKTSLINQYVNQEYPINYKATIGSDFFSKDVDIDGKYVTLQIWDSAGQENYQSIPTFYRWTNCLILVYDVTNAESFENINKWKSQFELQLGLSSNSNFPILLLGNKCDLQNKAVEESTAKKYAQKNGMIFHEVSAKTREGVESAFQEIVRKFLEKSPSFDFVLPSSYIQEEKNSGKKLKLSKRQKLQVCLAGESTVGKTAILERFTLDLFMDGCQGVIHGNIWSQALTINSENVDYGYQGTFADKIWSKTLTINSEKVDLDILDMDGNEKYSSLTKIYFKGAFIVILVFDLTQRKTFEDLTSWLDDIRTFCDPNCIVQLIGNKSDLNHKRVISFEEANFFAQRNNMNYMEVSAKSGSYISEAFTYPATKSIPIWNMINNRYLIQNMICMFDYFDDIIQDNDNKMKYLKTLKDQYDALNHRQKANDNDDEENKYGDDMNNFMDKMIQNHTISLKLCKFAKYICKYKEIQGKLLELQKRIKDVDNKNKEYFKVLMDQFDALDKERNYDEPDDDLNKLQEKIQDYEDIHDMFIEFDDTLNKLIVGNEELHKFKGFAQSIKESIEELKEGDIDANQGSMPKEDRIMLLSYRLQDIQNKIRHIEEAKAIIISGKLEEFETAIKSLNSIINDKAENDFHRTLEERLKLVEENVDNQDKGIKALQDKIQEMEDKKKDDDEQCSFVNNINNKFNDLGNLILEGDKKNEEDIKTLKEKLRTFIESQNKNENKNINELRNLFDQMNEKFNDLKYKYEKLENNIHRDEETISEVQSRSEDRFLMLQDINEKIERIERGNTSFKEENSKVNESHNIDIDEMKKLLNKLNNDIKETEASNYKMHSYELENTYANTLKSLEERLNKSEINRNRQNEEINSIKDKIRDIEDKFMNNLEQNMQEKFNDLNNRIQNINNNNENDIKALKQKIESFEDLHKTNEFNNYNVKEFEVIQDKLNNSVKELQEKVNYLTNATSMLFGSDNDQDESIIIKIHYAEDEIHEDKIKSNENALNILEGKVQFIKDQIRSIEHSKLTNDTKDI